MPFVAENDIKLAFVRIITAASYDDEQLMKQEITSLTEGERAAMVHYSAQYVVWLIRQLGFDPVTFAQQAGLWLQDGSPDPPSQT